MSQVAYRDVQGVGMTSARTRQRMIERLQAQGIKDPVVLAAMNELPRHVFVDPALESQAYDDMPLPIGNGQTISQPYVVARSAELARAGGPLGAVLEVGAGCGYQAAVLAKLSREVLAIERIAALVPKARGNLARARVNNVQVKLSDGSKLGLPPETFDAIVFAAAGAEVPEALTELLKVGGRLIVPLYQPGLSSDEQALTLIEKTPNGLHQRVIETVNFVPLLRDLA